MGSRPDRRIENLTEEVRAATVEGGPLDRVTHSAGIAADLSAAGDELVDHFVTEARLAGCSWAEVGTALGVTKQAAQQRFRPVKWQIPGLPSLRSLSPFTRFTAPARAAVINAQAEALDLKHNCIGTEHLLLGIAAGEGRAAELLAGFGITPENIRGRIKEVIGEGDARPKGHVKFGPRSKKALESSLVEAKRLSCKQISDEHVLLGLLALKEGVGFEIIEHLGADPDELREGVETALISG
jgi:hypothetical protein